MKEGGFSIIICTYNRATILSKCFESIVDAKKPKVNWDVILIDNNSEDRTKDVYDKYKEFLPLTYLKCHEVGLSHARNLGARSSSKDWLYYIDDDVLLLENTLIEVEKEVLTNEFSIIAGIFSPWYLDNKPKWFPDSFGKYNIIGSNKRRSLDLDPIIGCNMLIKKEALIKVNWFPTELGMSGKKIAYAEEVYVAFKIKEHGYKLGINPEINVLHLVANYKYSLKWQFESQFSKGRDIIPALGHRKKDLFARLIKSLLKPAFYFPANFFKVLTLKNEYYWKNFFVDTFSPLAYGLGMLKRLVFKQ